MEGALAARPVVATRTSGLLEATGGQVRVNFDRYWSTRVRTGDDYLSLLEDERAALSNPRRAIWVVPGLRGLQILLDKDGSLAALQKSAQEFDWSPLQPAADEFAAEMVMGNAEEVHKMQQDLTDK